MEITKDLFYVGVDDTEIDLFEAQYPVPRGISYNSYILKDKETAVFDGVEAKYADEWLEKLVKFFDGSTPSYIVVHHMEPDHSSSIKAFMHKFPTAKMVGSAQAIKMAEALFGENFSGRTVAVKDGDVLDLGKHTLHFCSAGMVHWPEVMMSYDEQDYTLFSADAFGTFGPFAGEEVWADEARRYYFGIVGKFGAQVLATLAKACKFPISRICPLHGPVLEENAVQCIELYRKWAAYEPEDGVVIAYASVYGNMKEAAFELKKQLESKGQKNVVIYDLARCDHSAAMADAFRYSKLAICSVTLNTEAFPAVKSFIASLVSHNYHDRFVALVECGMWAPTCRKNMESQLEACKDLVFDETRLKFVGRPNDEAYAGIALLADEIAGYTK